MIQLNNISKTFSSKSGPITALENITLSIEDGEIFGIIGMLASGWFTDRFLKGKAHRTCVFCMIGVAVFMTIFLNMPLGTPMWLMVIVLAMAGFFIYGPQALIGIAAANQATNRAAATANGLTGLFGYASGIVSGLGVGYMVDLINEINPDKSWDYVFMGMIGIAIIGTLVFLTMWGAKADGYDEEQVETKTENA